MKNDLLENRRGLGNHQNKVPNSKLLTGSLVDKYPIILDGGKTIVFVSDKNKEAEIRLRYKLRGK